MEVVNQLVDLLPVFIGCVIGSIVKDLVDFTHGKGTKHRALQIVISSVTTVIVLGFIVIPMAPPMDWKLEFGGSFGIGFLGYKLASLLSNTLFALSWVPGMDKIENAMERKEMQSRIDELEKKIDSSKDEA